MDGNISADILIVAIVLTVIIGLLLLLWSGRGKLKYLIPSDQGKGRSNVMKNSAVTSQHLTQRQVISEFNKPHLKSDIELIQKAAKPKNKDLLPYWKTIRIFISSTFLDMQAERDHLVRFVFPRLRERLLLRRVHLVDVDLRWGITNDQDASEACREIITECQGFMCMLGGRYGWIPEGKEHSITADEIHFGVLEDTPTKPEFALFYFRDDNSTVSIRENTPGEFRETRESIKQIKLTELKQTIVRAGFVPFTYRPLWDNETKRLTELKEFGNRVFDDLLASISSDSEIKDRVESDPSDLPNEFATEYSAMEAFVEAHREHYVLGSREPLLDNLISYATSNQGYVCLVGVPGSGKTALLAHLSQSAELTVQDSILLISHFVGVSAGSTDIRRTLWRICHELNDQHTTPIEIPEDDEKLRITFLKLFAQACANQRVVILIDAVNQFDLKTYSFGLRWLPETLPPNACIIFSTTNDPVLHELRKHLVQLPEFELPLLTEDDSAEIVKQFLQRYRKSLELDQRASLLGKTDAGIPLYLLAALEELRTLGNYHEINQRIAEIPHTTFELFTWILRRLEKDDGFRDASNRLIGHELVSRFARLLISSRYGLSQAELIDLLDDSDPQGNVAALLYLLRPYLMQRGNLIDFYHVQFRQAAEALYAQADSQRLASHRILGDYFERQVPNARKAIELPWQLRKAEERDRLKQHLLNIPLFILMKQIDQNEIIGYWDWLGEQQTMGSLYRSALEQWLSDVDKTTKDANLENTLVYELGWFLHQCGLDEDAEPLLRRAVALAEWVNGPTSIQLATALNNLALILMEKRDMEEAQSFLSRAFEIYEKVYGQNDPATATCINNIGLILHNRGQIKDAETSFRLALAIDEVALGADAPAVGRDLNNLGMLLKTAGQIEEAEQLLRRGLKIHELNFGLTDPDVATDLNNLASVLQEKEQMVEAEALMRQSLTIVENIFGKNHPRVAGSLEKLSELFEQQELFAEAESLLHRALAIKEAYYGSQDSELAMTLNNLGNLLHRIGRLQESETVLRRGLLMLENHSKSNSSDTAVLLSNLASVLKETGSTEDAEFMFRRALTIDETFFGDNHPRLELRTRNLGYLLWDKGDIAEAEKWLHRSLTIAESVFGSDHIKLSDAMQTLARFLSKTGQQVAAVSLYSRLLLIEEVHYGKDHPALVKNLVQLSKIYEGIGKFREAYALLQRALRILNAAGEQDDERLPHLLNQIGLLLRLEGHLDEAENFLRQALSREEQGSETRNNWLGVTLTNLSLVLHDKGQMPEAEAAAQRAVSIFEQAIDPDIMAYSSALNNLGLIYFSTNRLTDAEDMSRKGLEILFSPPRTPGDWDLTIRTSMQNYQILLRTLGIPQISIEYRLSTLIQNSGSKQPTQISANPSAKRHAYFERGLWRHLFKLEHVTKGKAIALPSRFLIATNLIFDNVSYPRSLQQLALSVIHEEKFKSENRVPYEIPEKGILSFCPLDMTLFVSVMQSIEAQNLLSAYDEGGSYNPGMSMGGGFPIIVTEDGGFMRKTYFWEEYGSSEDYFRLIKEFIDTDADFIDKSAGAFNRLRDEAYNESLNFIDSCLRAAKRDSTLPILKSGSLLMPLLVNLFPAQTTPLDLLRLLVASLNNICITMEDLAAIRLDSRIIEAKEIIWNTTSSSNGQLNLEELSQKIIDVVAKFHRDKQSMLNTSCAVTFDTATWPNSQVDLLPEREQWKQEIGSDIPSNLNVLMYWADSPQGRVCMGYTRQLFERF